uniref:PORR domain-containing protein n=1 Tax=Kalanchoe fedtschenkoi TaxID=63787 RepID=A0A7N0U730_KALFE
MALCLPISFKKDLPRDWSNTLLPAPIILPNSPHQISFKCSKPAVLSVTCLSHAKIVRSPVLDRHVTRQNKIRFVQKLRILLLSKPKHFMPLHILSRCRAYLALPTKRSILRMIRRYPTIFELFTIPYPPLPCNATKLCPQLCVRLTPAAAALAVQESNIKKELSVLLVAKLTKLLMLSPYRRLLLSKLAHLGPDLGLPENFRSRLCNAHPSKFRTVDTSYGRALELVSWDAELASSLPYPAACSRGLIVDRPLKFKQLNLRRGLNLKRRHEEFLFKFGEIEDICPYNTPANDLEKESIEAEKRACAVVREILGMTVEKRTLIDHLTHFRKDFGLPNKLRGMIVRHPELFYVSLKGQRDSVFLVEAYNDNGLLREKHELLIVKEKLVNLVMEGKKLRRDRKKAFRMNNCVGEYTNEGVCTKFKDVGYAGDDGIGGDGVDDYDDGFDSLFDFEDFDGTSDDEDDDEYDSAELEGKGIFWAADVSSLLSENRDDSSGYSKPW